ncbi:MAG TPA: DUF58 domain-containing protein, partial [Candidatus Polarisedimenticolaceae bacterium]|nr:DUF58 domain-containing protein [Candidatus Polarisedimenticolaceae bacterium]
AAVIVPERRLLWLLGVLVLAAALAVVFPEWTRSWAVLVAALLCVAAVDAVLGLRLRTPEVERRVPGSLSLGTVHPVTLSLRPTTAMKVAVFDHVPEQAEIEDLPLHLDLLPGGATEVQYRLRPTQRGAHAFGRIELRLRSPLGLWAVRRYAGSPQTVRVYPDFGTVNRFALLAIDHKTSALGVRRRPRRGEGLELHQLREYREGDSLRQIDWKATSRRMKPISREYQAERDQQVVFLLDCGRTMHARDAGRAHFDHALNAALLLSWVALRQGDAVGMLTFGGPMRWLPPTKGAGALTEVLHAVYDLETTTAVPDYTQAASDLIARQRRRALIVVLANLRDEDGEEMRGALHLLGRRHLVLLASLRETVLEDALEEPVASLPDALRVTAIHDYLAARRRAHRDLASRGVNLLDVRPSELPIALVNRYLDIKAAGAL